MSELDPNVAALTGLVDRMITQNSHQPESSTKSNLVLTITIGIGIIGALVSIVFQIIVVGGIDDLKEGAKLRDNRIAENTLAIAQNKNSALSNKETFNDIRKTLLEINSQVTAAGANRYYRSEAEKLESRVGKVEDAQRDGAYRLDRIEEDLEKIHNNKGY